MSTKSGPPKPPSSSLKFVQWMVRTEQGEQIGPYATESVLKLISEGHILGREKIKRHPDGEWLEISRQPEFYDRLLEALEEVVKRNSTKKGTAKVEFPKPPDDVSDTPIPSKAQASIPPEKEQVFLQSKPAPTTVSLYQVPSPPPESVRNIFLPVVLTLAAFLVGVAAWLYSDNTLDPNEKPHLLMPRLNAQASTPPEKIKEGLRRSVAAFLRDTYEGYQESQNLLVGLVEQSPQNTEARGLLCLVYKELWPFVKQDSQDLETVNFMMRTTRQLDPVGVNGIYCEVTKLFVVGKYREAKGVLDHSLNQTNLSSAPVLYNLKAEILGGDREFQTAALYAEKARKLWPEWVKPLADHGQFMNQAGQYQAAAASFQETLRMNPKHKEAAIELALLQFRIFRQSDAALTSLSAALVSPEKVSTTTESKANLGIAQILVEKRDSKKALSYAEKAFELNPSDRIAKELVIKLGGSGRLSKNSSQTNELVFLGDQYVRAGDCLAAQAEFKTAFELEPTNGVAAMKAAKCLWQLNQSNEAISWLSKAITADKKLAAAYVLQADYYSQKHDYISAVQVLTKASQQLTNSHEVLRGYGLVEFRRNNFKAALGYLQRSLKVYENDSETLILLSKVYGGLRDFKEALKYAIRAIEVDATNNEAQIVYSKVLSQLYGVDSGINYLKGLISRFSYTIEFRLGLAELYRESERFKLSQQVYEQIVEVDPRNKRAFMGLGESLQAQGLFEKALHAYLNAAIADPSDVEALFKAGLLYLERDKYSEAITQFQRALKINPMFPRLNYYIGKAYYLNGDYNFALTSALAERKVNPNLAESYLLAAEVYTTTKQFQKCAEEYQQAIKLRPSGAELYVKLARCYRQSGSLDIAENMLNIAASQESGNPEIYREQGAIYETKNDVRSAVAAYSKYLALSPNAPDRREIEARVQKLDEN